MRTLASYFKIVDYVDVARMRVLSFKALPDVLHPGDNQLEPTIAIRMLQGFIVIDDIATDQLLN